MLNRRITGRFINREGGGEFRPRELMTGPKVCLINEFTSSDGEQFAYFFNQAAVGQLVGKRTAGSVRGISGSWDLLDGGSITFPINALYADSGEPLIEGGGVAPGVEVDNGSMGSFGTHDQQLNAAIKLALRQLERSSSPLVGK
jgi:tricorn protease